MSSVRRGGGGGSEPPDPEFISLRALVIILVGVAVGIAVWHVPALVGSITVGVVVVTLLVALVKP